MARRGPRFPRRRGHGEAAVGHWHPDERRTTAAVQSALLAAPEEIGSRSPALPNVCVLAVFWDHAKRWCREAPRRVGWAVAMGMVCRGPHLVVMHCTGFQGQASPPPCAVCRQANGDTSVFECRGFAPR